jgi:hypothetical protein
VILPAINSVQTADRVYETQARPILIACNDGFDYVCKYGAGAGFAARLLSEYIGWQFARIWGIGIPEAAFVRISPGHIPASFGIPAPNFTQTCFGARYSRSYAELTRMNALAIATQFKKPEFKRSLLLVGLFDCWLANEDRNPNNYNLMFDLEQNYRLVAIDNEGIFNTRIYEHPIYSLNENDTILLSPFACKLFGKQDVTKDALDQLMEILYICTENCEQKVNDILSQIPQDWSVDISMLKSKLSEVFSVAWKTETLGHFQTFVQLLLNRL